MATDGIYGIDPVEDLYTNTYNTLKKVSTDVAAEFATAMKLQGADSSLDIGTDSSDLISQIQDTYTSTLNDLSTLANSTTSGIYNSSGLLNSLSSVASSETDTSTDTIYTTLINSLSDDETTLLTNIQKEFNVSTNTIVSTMQNLGFTFNDLFEKENMMALAVKLNEDMSTYGFKPVDDISASVDSLYDGLGEGGDNSQMSMGTSMSGASADSGTTEEEEYSSIVVIGDTTYLETTTIKNGSKTVVRTPMS